MRKTLKFPSFDQMAIDMHLKFDMHRMLVRVLVHVGKNANNETIDPLFAHTTDGTSLDNDFQWENVPEALHCNINRR